MFFGAHRLDDLHRLDADTRDAQRVPRPLISQSHGDELAVDDALLDGQ